MAAHDTYHEQVKRALIKDGWTITHDPYILTFGFHKVYVDLGAERVLAAERGEQKIAVEIKTFRGTSEIRDFEVALGQYVLYRSLLARFEPDRKLYLAVPEEISFGLLELPIAQPVLEDQAIAIVAFDPDKEQIVQWRP
jgi:hypothetical protein